MLEGAIQEFPIPSNSPLAEGITAGPGGVLWFTDEGAAGQTGLIGEIDPTTHAIVEFPIPTSPSSPGAITEGPDGNLWFTDRGSNVDVGPKVGVFNPTTHAVEEFPLPAVGMTSPVGVAEDITAGPDGNLWFTVPSAIGQINPTTHAITEFPIPGGGAPAGITTGPDGNLWFADQAGKVGEINPTTHVLAEFPIPVASNPFDITAGPDGQLWFTGGSGSVSIGSIDPTTHAIAVFSIPTPDSFPGAIAAGSDGNLYFTEFFLPAIGQFNPKTHAFAQFPGNATLGSTLNDVTPGPDGNVWFTELRAIGQLDVAPSPDLVLSGISTPSSVNGLDHATFALTVTNVGDVEATGVTLTDVLPAGSRFASATGGVEPVNGGLTFSIGSLAPGASDTVNIVVLPDVPGVLVNQAAVVGDQRDPTPGNNAISQFFTVPDGPTVLDLQRFGYHAQPTTLVLTFSMPLVPASAENLANYRIVTLGRHGRVGARAGHVTLVRAAAYDPATQTVTLVTSRRLDVHKAYRLTVNGSTPRGLVNPSGMLLDGAGIGLPGSDFVGVIDRGTLAGPSPAISGLAHHRRTSRTGPLGSP